MQRKLILLFVISLLLPATLLAQGYGKISGKVTDANTGEELVGASIRIEGTSLGASSSLDGTYYILDVRPGSYVVHATYVGYQELTVSNVIVTSELTTELNLRLYAEAVQVPVVQVTAERPLVTKSATNEIRTMRAEDIANIPTRGYIDVIGLQTGVVRIGNNVYVRGGRTDEVAFFIDGMIVNNPYDSRNAGTVVNEALEEVTYQGGGFNAEYGFANAGLVSATTKAGGEKLAVSFGAITDEFLKKDRPPADPVERILQGRESPSGLESYGTSILHATLSGPLPGTAKVRFALAGQYSVQLDGSPSVGRAYYQPDNRSQQTAVNSNLTFDLSPINVRVGGFSSIGKSRVTSQFQSIFNSSRNDVDEASTHSYYVKLTHTLGSSTFYTLMGSWFQTQDEQGDPVWWDDIPSYGDIAKNPILASPGRNPANVFHNLFGGEGYVPFGGTTNGVSFAYNRSSYYGGKLDFSHQTGPHFIKLGGEIRYNTIRYWSTQANRYALALAADATLSPEQALRASYTNNLGMAVDGVGPGRRTFLDEGRDGAPHPIIAAAYVQDKIELEDLVLNLGVRADYINPNVDVYRDPLNIAIESVPLSSSEPGGGGYLKIAESNFVPGKANTTLSPRLGFSFPVTDRTVFHAEYGHFIQQVELNRLFTSTTVLVQELTAGNYVNVGNPSLKPEKTISYEVGFSQQMGENASLDLTAYYKDVRDLIQLKNVFAQPTAYALFVNGDYGTIKGLSVAFQLRRTNRVAATVNYTLQYASGTGSVATTNFNIAWLGGNFPTFVSPLSFDQRHTGNANIDFRTLADDGPTFLGGKPFGRVGVNLLLTFGSGRPYTPADPKTILFGPAWETPTAAYNQTYSPWNIELDLKVDKTFSMGSTDVNVYLWMLNVLNTKNVVTVLDFTGQPDDDGYFQTAAGQQYAKTEGAEAEQGYRYRLGAPANWGVPRQLRLGFRVDI
jgi:outer membrane receptor protein involved in Fe transport